MPTSRKDLHPKVATACGSNSFRIAYPYNSET